MTVRRSRVYNGSSDLVEISALIALALLVSLFAISKTANVEMQIKALEIEPTIITDYIPPTRVDLKPKPSLITPRAMDEVEENLFPDEPLAYDPPDFTFVPPPAIIFKGVVEDLADKDVIPYNSVQDPPKLINSEKKKLIAAVSENYPKLARISGTNGSVKLNFICSKEGIPTSIEIVKEEPGSLGFGEAAVAALRTIRFTPGYQNDKPVAVRMSLPISFELRK